MYLYFVYLKNLLLFKNGYLPKAISFVLEDLQAKNSLVTDSEKSIRIVSNSGKVKILTKIIQGDELIMFVDDEGDEVYRVEKEKLK